MQAGFQMVLDQKLQIKVTPEFKMSIDILQCSSVDLTAHLWDLTLDNPVLEVEMQDNLWLGGECRKSDPQHDPDPLANAAAKHESLYEHVAEQLRLLDIPKALYRACIFLAGNLDECGYLTITADETARILNIDATTFDTSLKILHSLDPVGIGARDLKECLLIQINRDSKAPDLAKTIVHSYLECLAKGQYEKIAKALRIEIAELNEAVSYIQMLNPRPALHLSAWDQDYIVPDAEVVRERDRYIVRILDNYLPKLVLNPEYCTWARENDLRDTEKYIKRKFHEAQMVIRSLKRRKTTLQRVIASIFEEQESFLRLGVEGLEPINLKAIAERTGFHTSTVSRAVQNKYVQTPHGLFPLNFFFSSGVETANGRQTSNKILQNYIKEIIEREDKRKPLSDQQIANMLKRRGFDIARRTVAKYREESGILSSSYRRRVN